MDQRINVITLGVADVPRGQAFYEQVGSAVDQICADARTAGATVTRAPVVKPFGYSGVFADPDGHTWEVAYIEALTLNSDGTVAIPS